MAAPVVMGARNGRCRRGRATSLANPHSASSLSVAVKSRGVADDGVFFFAPAVQFVGGRDDREFPERCAEWCRGARFFRPTRLRCWWRMPCASRTISGEMEGWSSMRFWGMRFCSMKGQDSIGHLENEIHFRRGGKLAEAPLFVLRAWTLLQSSLVMSAPTATGVPASRGSTGYEFFCGDLSWFF